MAIVRASKRETAHLDTERGPKEHADAAGDAGHMTSRHDDPATQRQTL